MWYCLIIILCSTEKQYFEILVYHENLVTISFIIIILSIIFGLVEKLNKILPKTLKVYCDSHVRGGKWSSLEPHSLSIALLDWTIKQKRQNRNMGYVCIFALNFQ